MKAEIGKRIETIRKEMNLTKESLAEKIGVSGQFLGSVERGKNSLTYEKLENLCNISGYTSDYILFGKSKKVPEQTKQELLNFTDREIINACNAIKEIAVYIKNSKE